MYSVHSLSFIMKLKNDWVFFVLDQNEWYCIQGYFSPSVIFALHLQMVLSRLEMAKTQYIIDILSD